MLRRQTDDLAFHDGKAESSEPKLIYLKYENEININVIEKLLTAKF